MGQGPEGQGGGGRIPELISTNEKPKKTGPLSPAGKQDCPSLVGRCTLGVVVRHALRNYLKR